MYELSSNLDAVTQALSDSLDYLETNIDDPQVLATFIVDLGFFVSAMIATNKITSIMKNQPQLITEEVAIYQNMVMLTENIENKSSNNTMRIQKGSKDESKKDINSVKLGPQEPNPQGPNVNFKLPYTFQENSIGIGDGVNDIISKADFKSLMNSKVSFYKAVNNPNSTNGAFDINIYPRLNDKGVWSDGRVLAIAKGKVTLESGEAPLAEAIESYLRSELQGYQGLTDRHLKLGENYLKTQAPKDEIVSFSGGNLTNDIFKEGKNVSPIGTLNAVAVDKLTIKIGKTFARYPTQKDIITNNLKPSRQSDAEQKIIEVLSHYLEKNPTAKIKMELYIDRSPCQDTCNFLIDNFVKSYSDKVELTLIHGPISGLTEF